MDDAQDVIQEFFYTNAPSFCLFESILALHLNVLQVVTFLFEQVKLISEYFNCQKEKDRTETVVVNNTANMGVLLLVLYNTLSYQKAARKMKIHKKCAKCKLQEAENDSHRTSI